MRAETVVRHLTQRGGVYYYWRRVPARYQASAGCQRVRRSLETRDLDIARKRVLELDRYFEALWAAQAAGMSHDQLERWDAAVSMAHAKGFRYRDGSEITDPIELIERIEAIGAASAVTEREALLGLARRPKITLSAALEDYLTQTMHERAKKTASQKRIIENGRHRAVRAMIDAIGDLELEAITREHVLEYREALRRRVDAGEISAETANKDIGQLRVVLRTVCDLRALSMPPMEKLSFKVKAAAARGEGRKVLPFDPEWIQGRILAPGALAGLNDEARRIVFAMVETGLRPSELCNILPENIRIDDAVPHLRITATDFRDLKTAHSDRRVPLVGVSLMAMRAQPAGFPRYHDGNQRLSSAVNKFMRDHRLFPSARHRLYSLRHAFEDRLIAAGMDYRVRKDLMGHDIDDQAYGVGARLEDVCAQLAAIAFQPPPEV
ncbi:MAG: integrase [Neomegalonema sp.]|nr:integrase [Neomegalonema sp.]